MSRDEVLGLAIDMCMKEIYSKVQPKVEWEDFKEQCEEYSKKYKEWETLEPRPDIKEYCGPKPYEFYYIPNKVMKEICDSYIHSFNLDHRQELLDTIETLKNYCKEPIVDKYIEGELREDGTRWPGHRGYDHPDNLEKELEKILAKYDTDIDLASSFQNKFFEFLDMAGEFFNWNRDLNTFNVSVYLGPSPNSNKEAVIDNWKKYRNTDISIDESVYEEEEYD